MRVVDLFISTHWAFSCSIDIINLFCQQCIIVLLYGLLDYVVLLGFSPLHLELLVSSFVSLFLMDFLRKVV